MDAALRTDMLLTEVRRQEIVSAFMTKVYGWMGAGLAVTGVTAFGCSLWIENNIEWLVANSWVMWVPCISALLLSLVIQGWAMKMPSGVTLVLFMIYAMIMGMALSPIFIMYQLGSIAAAFFVTAGAFAALSIFGLATKRDLSGMGGILMFLMFGLIIATIVNWFWANSTLYWICTYAGVVIFSLLTAYQSQNLKKFALAADSDLGISAGQANEIRQRGAVLGALVLYICFVQIFIYMLRIMGDRR